jgi:hypothetical protein
MLENPGATNVNDYNCNSNDVRVANVTLKEVRNSTGVLTKDASGFYTCTQGEVLSVDFTANLENTNAKGRYDVAAWWRFGGNSSITSPEADCEVTSFTTAGLSNLDILDGANDICGDLAGKAIDQADVCGLTILCDDPTKAATNAVVRVATCLSWKVPGVQNTVCAPLPSPVTNASVTQFLPSSASKCKCNYTDFPIKIERCTLEATCLLENKNVDCAKNIPLPETDIGKVFNITSKFPCQVPKMTRSDVFNGGAGCKASPLVVTRTYTLSDDVERTSDVNCTQVITVIDDVPPAIDCGTSTIIKICSELVPPAPVGKVTDNCDAAKEVVPDCCFSGTGVQRTYKAADSCGNPAKDCVQTVAFSDKC